MTTADKLALMREINRRNDEAIREYIEKRAA